MKKQKIEKQAQLTDQEQMEKDININALEKLTQAMKEYENASGNVVSAVHITGPNIDADLSPMTDETGPVDRSFPEEKECCSECEFCGCNNDNIGPDQETVDEYVYHNVVSPILTLFPVSTIHAGEIIDEFNLDPNMQNYMTELRNHNEMMARAVGNIAYATTAMMLEYQTQAMAHQEMCRIVNKDGKPVYTAPVYDEEEF